jgi:hypothetical protein
VWVLAGTSPDGMYFTNANPQGMLSWDYVVLDGHAAAFKQLASPEDLRVVSGMFDYNWRFASALQAPGDAAARAQSRQLARPDPHLKIDPKVLAGYVGRYQIVGGPLVEMKLDGGKLIAFVRAPAEMIPEGKDVFYAPSVPVRVFFTRDETGKLTGFTGFGDGDFEAKRLD